MSRANQKKALVWKSSTTGLPQTGATIELRRGASTVTLTEIDTSGTYVTDSIPVGEWAVWVDSANTGYTVAVGAGEASEPDYTTETGKYARSKADGSGFELVPLTVPFSALTEKPTTISGYGITDAHTKTESDAAYAKKADVHTKTESDATYAKKNGNIAEAFSALSATIAGNTEVRGRDYTAGYTATINNESHSVDVTLESRSSYLVTAQMWGSNCEITKTAIIATGNSTVRLDIAEQNGLDFNLGTLSLSRTAGGNAGTYTANGDGNSLRITWGSTDVSGNCNVAYSIKRFH